MNCQEARGLFEDALDRRLSGGVRRKFDLHLSRCRPCRTLYEAEQAEHARWFRALNAAEPSPALPPDFAARLVASVLASENARDSFFRRFRLPRWAGLAATLALLAAAFAVVWTGEQAVSRHADEVTAASAGLPTADATQSLMPAASHPAVLVEEETGQGIPNMIEGESEVKSNIPKKAAALAGALALSSPQPAAAGGDGYAFIISGYPAANECRSARSAGTALEAGFSRSRGEPSGLEARHLTRGLSSGSALDSTEFTSMMIIFR